MEKSNFIDCFKTKIAINGLFAQMKNLKFLIFFSTFLHFNISTSAQKTLDQRDLKSIRSVKDFLIKNNTLDGQTAISDTIVFLEYSNVFDLLKSDHVNDLKLLDSLNILDHQYRFKSFYCQLSKDNISNYNKVAFFSKPINNTLLVEIVEVSPKSGFEYSKQTQFTNSIIYLFVLDQKGRVIDYKQIPFSYG